MECSYVRDTSFVLTSVRLWRWIFSTINAPRFTHFWRKNLAARKKVAGLYSNSILRDYSHECFAIRLSEPEQEYCNAYISMPEYSSASGYIAPFRCSGTQQDKPKQSLRTFEQVVEWFRVRRKHGQQVGAFQKARPCSCYNHKSALALQLSVPALTNTAPALIWRSHQTQPRLKNYAAAP